MMHAGRGTTLLAWLLVSMSFIAGVQVGHDAPVLRDTALDLRDTIEEVKQDTPDTMFGRSIESQLLATLLPALAAAQAGILVGWTLRWAPLGTVLAPIAGTVLLVSAVIIQKPMRELVQRIRWEVLR